MPWRWRCLVAMLRCYWSPGFFDSSSQLVCILGSGISHLPLERCSVGFRSGELAGQSSAVIIWSENHLVVVLALWAGGKGNWHLLKACQEMEAWSVVKPPGRRPHWLRTSDQQTPQIISDCRKFTVDFKQLEFCVESVDFALPHFDTALCKQPAFSAVTLLRVLFIRWYLHCLNRNSLKLEMKCCNDLWFTSDELMSYKHKKETKQTKTRVKPNLQQGSSLSGQLLLWRECHCIFVYIQFVFFVLFKHSLRSCYFPFWNLF